MWSLPPGDTVLHLLTYVALAAQAMGLLNAYDRYGIPASASAFFNIGSVTVGVAIAVKTGDPV